MIRKGMKAMVAAFGVTAAVAGASVAQAAPSVDILFDPTGGGNGDQIESLDLNVGNSLAQGGNSALVGEEFTVYFQSSIGSVNYAGANTSGLVSGTDYYITVVATFSEQKAYEIPGVVAGFTEGPGLDSLQVYISPTQTFDNLAGTGFESGTLILESSNISILGGANFGVGPVNEWGNLDQRAGNDYPDQYTVSGSGSSQLEATLSYVNNAYFQGLNAGDIISLSTFSTLNSVPFLGVDPSALFGNGLVPPDLGTINGLSEATWNALDAGSQAAILAQLGLDPGTQLEFGDDIQFQTNGAITFSTTNTPVIPEPATAALGLFGLAGLAIASRRRRA